MIRSPVFSTFPGGCVVWPPGKPGNITDRVEFAAMVKVINSGSEDAGRRTVMVAALSCDETLK